MNLTDHIINVALLGTATRELITTDFPEELQETLRDIQAKAEDAEALFYQQSALGFAFARAGVEAQSIAGVTNVTEAPEEDKPYFLREVESEAVHRQRWQQPVLSFLEEFPEMRMKQ